MGLRAAIGTIAYALLLIVGAIGGTLATRSAVPTGALIIGTVVGVLAGWKVSPGLREQMREHGMLVGGFEDVGAVAIAAAAATIVASLTATAVAALVLMN